MPLNAHRMVIAQARSMAYELSEIWFREVTGLYPAMRTQLTEKQARKLFVDRVAPKLYEEARQALTDLLAQPDERVPRAMKDEIAEALIMDNDLRANRVVAPSKATIPPELLN
jgi:hypothetical protein